MRGISVQVGDRIRLVHCDDRYTKLVPGDEGTVTFVDATGTVFVDWDSGSSLGLVWAAGDRFERLGTAEVELTGRAPSVGNSAESV